MKTEVIKQVVVKFEKEERELIQKATAVINNLITAGSRNNCSYYEMNDICRDEQELENLVEFLGDLVYTDVIELT